MKFSHCKFCGGSIQNINKSLSLVECNSCGLVFSRIIFSQDQLEDLYAELYNAEKKPGYEVHSVKEFEQLKQGKVVIGYNRARLINRNIKKNSKVLEIGAGVGVVGVFLNKKYPNVEYEGIELDEETSEKAQSFGLKVYTGDFKLIKNLKNEYDIIMLWEVLEHIQDIKLCLDLIFEKLAKGGVLLFSVPNFDKKINYKQENDKIFQSGPPIHLNFFRKSSIKKIFESNQTQVKSMRAKRMPYFNPNSKQFWKMLPKVITGKYYGSTLYCAIKIK